MHEQRRALPLRAGRRGEAPVAASRDREVLVPAGREMKRAQPPRAASVLELELHAISRANLARVEQVLERGAHSRSALAFDSRRGAGR